MLQYLRFGFSLLSAKNKQKYLFLILLRMLNSTMELVGLGVVVPLVTILVDFESALNIKYIRNFYVFCGEPSKSDFLTLLFTFSCSLIVMSFCINLLTAYTMGRFNKRLNAELSGRLLNAYLNMPLETFYSRSFTEFSKDMNSLSVQISQGILSASGRIIARAWQVLLIIMILALKNIVVALCIGIIISVCYFAIYKFLKPQIKHLSQLTHDQQGKLQQYLRDGYANYRDVLMYQAAKKLSHDYLSLKQIVTNRNANTELLGSLPKSIIELTAVLSVLTVAYWQGAILNNASVVSDLVLYVIAGYRMLPSVQQIYHSFNGMLGVSTIMDKKHDILELFKYSPVEMPQVELPLRHVQIKNLLCKKSDGENLITDFSCEFPLQGVIKVEGPSGVGKTTLLEVMFGLREYAQGEILFDGVPLTNRIKPSLWSQVAYCSQHSLIYEASLISNIVLWRDEIDYSLLEKACRISGLDVIAQKIGGMEVNVGEQSLVLSGGERQRIILARAIYKNTKILILDESFSAIDLDSTRKILESLRAEYKNRCMFIITHREDCLAFDKVLRL